MARIFASLHARFQKTRQFLAWKDRGPSFDLTPKVSAAMYMVANAVHCNSRGLSQTSGISGHILCSTAIPSVEEQTIIVQPRSESVSSHMWGLETQCTVTTFESLTKTTSSFCGLLRCRCSSCICLRERCNAILSVGKSMVVFSLIDGNLSIESSGTSTTKCSVEESVGTVRLRSLASSSTSTANSAWEGG